MAVPSLLYKKSVDWNRGERRAALMYALRELAPHDLAEYQRWLKHRFPSMHRDEQAVVHAIEERLRNELPTFEIDMKPEPPMLQRNPYHPEYSAIGSYWNHNALSGDDDDDDDDEDPATARKNNTLDTISDPNFWVKTFSTGVDNVKKIVCMTDPYHPMCEQQRANQGKPPVKSAKEVCASIPATSPLALACRQRGYPTAPANTNNANARDIKRTAPKNTNTQPTKSGNQGLVLVGALGIAALLFLNS
jgi:hypothetical protein